MALTGSAGGRRVLFSKENAGNSLAASPNMAEQAKIASGRLAFEAEQLILGHAWAGAIGETRQRFQRRVAFGLVTGLEVAAEEHARVPIFATTRLRAKARERRSSNAARNCSILIATLRWPVETVWQKHPAAREAR